MLRHLTHDEKVDLAGRLSALRSRVGYRGPFVSLEEMDAAVLREAVRAAPAPTIPGMALRKPSSKPPR